MVDRRAIGVSIISLKKLSGMTRYMESGMIKESGVYTTIGTPTFLMKS